MNIVDSARICESLAMTAAMMPAPRIPASHSGANCCEHDGHHIVARGLTAQRCTLLRRHAAGAEASACRASSFCSIRGTSRMALAATPRNTQGSQMASMHNG